MNPTEEIKTLKQRVQSLEEDKKKLEQEVQRLNSKVESVEKSRTQELAQVLLHLQVVLVSSLSLFSLIICCDCKWHLFLFVLLQIFVSDNLHGNHYYNFLGYVKAKAMFYLAFFCAIFVIL